LAGSENTDETDRWGDCRPTGGLSKSSDPILQKEQDFHPREFGMNRLLSCGAWKCIGIDEYRLVVS
jgi:hypothetical protein